MSGNGITHKINRKAGKLAEDEWQGLDSHEGGTGRAFTYIVAASDAPLHVKAQADDTCDGTDDHTKINTYLALGNVLLTVGTFSVADEILVPSNTIFEGQGNATILQRSGNRANIIQNSDTVGGNTGIVIRNMYLDGVTAGAGKPGGGGSVYLWNVTDSRAENLVISASWNHGLEGSSCQNVQINNVKCINGCGDDYFSISDSVSPTNPSRYIYLNGCYAEYHADLEQSGYEVDDEPQYIYFNNCVAYNCSFTVHGHAGFTPPKHIYYTNCIATSTAATSYASWVIHGLDDYSDESEDIQLIDCSSIGVVDISNCIDVKIIGGYYSYTGATYGSVLLGRNFSGFYMAGATVANSSYFGIMLTNGTGFTVTGFVVSGVTFHDITRAHFYLYATGGTLNDVKLLDNIHLDKPSGYNQTNHIELSGAAIVNRLLIDSNTYFSSAGNRAIYFSTPSTATTSAIIRNNLFTSYTTLIGYTGTGSPTVKAWDNEGYIAKGEVRSASGSLTAGNANAICFAWHNPEVQDILIKKVVIEVTTGGGTVGSQLDVGIADDATGTNRGTEFFDDLLLNNAQVDDSWVAGDGGTQTKWVFCQDSASATDGWIVGQILTQNAASLVGSYYIEYEGR